MSPCNQTQTPARMSLSLIKALINAILASAKAASASPLANRQ